MVKQKMDPKKQREVIKANFSMIKGDILFFDRPKTVTPYQEREGFFIAEELLVKNNCRKMILDLRAADLLSLETRHIVQKYLPKISESLDHLVLIIDNSLLRSAIRFVLLPIKYECTFSMTQTEEKALGILGHVDNSI